MIELNKEILFEINETDKLEERYKVMFDELKFRAPNNSEIDSVATALHSFYNGIEKIFEMIAAKLDKFIPQSNRTHKELLYNAHVGNDIRPAVINRETYFILDDYLKFRHFFRHSYSFHLRWDKMESLADNLFDTWKTVKEQLLTFVEFLEKDKLN